jgi:hypothetical protein
MQKPYTLAGFEPGIICSVDGCDDYYATPLGHKLHIFLSYDNSTAMYSLKPNTLAGFEPGIICSGDGCDDQYATALGNKLHIYEIVMVHNYCRSINYYKQTCADLTPKHLKPMKA